MRKTPRQRAEACFAVARSTPHAAERQAAIGRGEAICTKHGLDPADFDIPGRSRARSARARPRFTFTIYDSEIDGLRAPRRETVSTLQAGLERFGESLKRAAAAAGAFANETPYDARRRNFDQAAAEARERDRRRAAEKASKQC